MRNGRYLIAAALAGTLGTFASAAPVKADRTSQDQGGGNSAPQRFVLPSPTPPASEAPRPVMKSVTQTWIAPTAAPTLPTTTPPPTTPPSTPSHHDRDHDRDRQRDRFNHEADRTSTVFITPGDLGFLPTPPGNVGGADPVPPLDIPRRPAIQTPAFDPVAAAQNFLDQVRAQLQSQFETSPSYQDALEEKRVAETADTEAIARARAGLKDQVDYKDALAAKERTAHAVAAAQRDARRAANATQPSTQPAPIPADLFRAAQAKLAAAAKVSEIEQRLLNTNPDVIAARQRLDTATHRVQEMQSTIAAAVESNPAVFTAKRRLDAAKTASAMGPDLQAP